MVLASRKLKRDWREFSFSHLIHFWDWWNQNRNVISGQKVEFSWEKEKKKERESNVNGLRKERAMYVTKCHQM